MKLGKLFQSERGASAVEFAILISVLVMILLGTIQFGVAYNRLQGLQAAAREGARIASLPESTVQMIKERTRGAMSAINSSAGNESCPPGVDEYCIQITPSGSSSFQPCNLNSGETVVVNVSHKLDIPIPFWESPPLTMTGHGEFRCE
jgi:Flp pilus assembly protein TadG